MCLKILSACQGYLMYAHACSKASHWRLTLKANTSRNDTTLSSSWHFYYLIWHMGAWKTIKTQSGISCPSPGWRTEFDSIFVVHNFEVLWEKCCMNISVWGPYTGWVIHRVDSGFFKYSQNFYSLRSTFFGHLCMHIYTHTQVQPHSINSKQLRSSKYRYFSSKILKIQ